MISTFLRTRRDFLCSSLRIAAAAPLISGVLRGASTENPPGCWRAAVIGHTGRGDYGHGLDEIFQGRSGVCLAAVADADAAGLAKAGERLGIAEGHRYASYVELLRRERPQLVAVAPRQADQHASMVEAALRAGAHVYCEKPFTPSPAEADKLLTLAARQGLRVAVAHQMRLAPEVTGLRAAVARGLIGDLVEMRGYGKQDARAGGEDLMVLGTHVFDLMRLFAGDPVSCAARVTTQGRPVTRADRRRVKDDIGPVAGDEVEASFEFSGGVHGSFTSRGRLRETVGAWGLELVGTRGRARINANIPPRVFLLRTAGWDAGGRTDRWEPFPAPGSSESGEGGSPFAIANRRVVDDWMEAIRVDREPECSARNAAWAVEMVMAVYGSSLGRREVRFPLPDRAHPLRSVPQKTVHALKG